MKTICIVDDNRHLLTYLERHLVQAGFEVFTAMTGLSAVERLSEKSVDVIFVDYFLPNLNADQLCRTLRRMDHLKNAYIVVMSAAATELGLDLAAIQADALIAKGSFKETLRVVRVLLKDEHDLIHKACGWMLREVGKRDLAVEEEFLQKHYKSMPRTMLRYAIERFPEPKRQAYLKGNA